MQHAGLRHRTTSRSCSATRRSYLGFVEVHIEQGPVLNELDLPLGIVTSINGSVRYVGEVHRHGQPRRHHADGPPARRRRRGGRAGALRRAARGAAMPNLVGTVGMLAGAQRLDQRGARAAASSASTSAPPPTRCATPARPTCWPSCKRSASGAACATRIEETMRAAAAPSAPDMAAALGARGRRARPAGVPHAQRRRPRRDEAARGDAAGDAVRARRQRRHQPQPARIDHQRRHRSSRSRPSSTCSNNLRHRASAMSTTDYDQLDAWIDAHFDEEVRFLQAAGARAHRHAARQQRAARRAHGRAARRTSASRPSSTRCPTQEVQGYGLAVDHQPDRAPPLRRRADDRAQRARRRGAARRRLDARSLRRRDRRRQALRPRRGGQQERLRDLHLRAARARGAGAAAAAAASSCTSPTTRSSAASSARAGC